MAWGGLGPPLGGGWLAPCYGGGGGDPYVLPTAASAVTMLAAFGRLESCSAFSPSFGRRRLGGNRGGAIVCESVHLGGANAIVVVLYAPPCFHFPVHSFPLLPVAPLPTPGKGIGAGETSVDHASARKCGFHWQLGSFYQHHQG